MWPGTVDTMDTVDRSDTNGVAMESKPWSVGGLLCLEQHPTSSITFKKSNVIVKIAVKKGGTA